MANLQELIDQKTAARAAVEEEFTKANEIIQKCRGDYAELTGAINALTEAQGGSTSEAEVV